MEHMPSPSKRVRPIPARDLQRIFHPANDRFEREYEPTPWDDDGLVTAALERDAREYELLAKVGGVLVLLLGVVVWIVL